MKRFFAGLLAALMSGAAWGQMGGAMSTSQYFPLVEGARYDYMYTGGPWSSSTAVMHGGQTWAGFPGLTAMHTTYTCRVGIECPPDATDFYRMDPDGMHYFGGTGSDASGARFSMMSLTNPEWILKNPAVPGTMMGGGYQNPDMWQANVSGSSSMMGSQGYMSSYQALALETVTTPAGTFSNALHVREQRGSGVVRDVWYAPGVGMVRMNDGSSTAELVRYSMAGGTAAIAFTPFAGLWWNPDESGSGYNIQVQHGVVVATVFSYAASGDPVLYYAYGPLANSGSGVMVTASLDKYQNGQCAMCTYRPPVPAGSDGAVTITFSSPNSATVQFPGGRTARIQPQPW